MEFLTQKLNKILAGPEFPDKEFVVSLCPYKNIYAMASHIREVIAGKNETVCLFTENKGIIIASILASLSSDFKLVMPYSLSSAAAYEIRKEFNCQKMITDQPEKLPLGITPIVPLSMENFLGSLPLSKSVNQPFLMFYTGGSTGKPKVWSKTPNNLFGEAFYLSGKFGFCEKDRILATVVPYHIYGFLFSVLIPFVSSCSTIEEICFFPQEIRNYIQNYFPTILVSIPVHYRILKGGEIPLGSLRLAFSSAGKLDKEDGDYFYGKTGVDLYEIYGSTETGGIASRCRARGESELMPFGVVDWKITDEFLFVRSPFISPEIIKDQYGFFKTGDRGFSENQKAFSILGRTDGIIKVGGKRVDLENIRSKIIQIPGVTDAIAFALSDLSGRENNICAMVQGNISKEQIKSVILKQMEPYAIPRHIRIVEKIPVSESGKYDKKLLEKYFEF